MSAPDLAAFILQMLAEDEAAARRAGSARWEEWGIESGDAEHIARHDPARVLADVEAKRRIVELHPTDHAWHADRFVPVCTTCRPYAPAPCGTLRALAAVYSHHPDYREAWRP